MKNKIAFDVVIIKVEQFATFLENYEKNSTNIALSHGFGVYLDIEQKAVVLSLCLNFADCDSLISFLKLQVRCIYQIRKESWDNFLKLNLKTSKEFLSILAEKTIDTSRGILFEKLRDTEIPGLKVPIIDIDSKTLSFLHSSITKDINHASTINPTAVG